MEDGLSLIAIRYQLRVILRHEAERLGQEKLAEVVGSHQPNVNRVLNSEDGFRPETVINWLERLGYRSEIKIVGPEQGERQ